jgi:hypothetical protein
MLDSVWNYRCNEREFLLGDSKFTFDPGHVGIEHVESVDKKKLIPNGRIGLYLWIGVIVVLSLFIFISFLGEGLYHKMLNEV